jgi:hypothetical protein
MNQMMNNGYSTLANVSAERERIRNELIDALGRKPTEQEIDQVLMASAEGESLPQQPAIPFQQ